MDLRRHLFSFLAAAPLLMSAAAVAQTQVEPSLAPDGESVMEDPVTAAACLARATDLGAKLEATPGSAGYFEWQLGVPLVTHSDVWGVICRIDFTMSGADVSPRINRLVLYAGAEKINVMIAIGQDIAPLAVAQTDMAPAP